MGIKRPVDFRFPERVASYTQGGGHYNTVGEVWQVAFEFTNKRGTMYVRQYNYVNPNWFTKIRITIDGVAYPIYGDSKSGLGQWWIFDFNESVKVEHYHVGIAYSRVEWAYSEYRP